MFDETIQRILEFIDNGLRLIESKKPDVQIVCSLLSFLIKDGY